MRCVPGVLRGRGILLLLLVLLTGGGALAPAAADADADAAEAVLWYPTLDAAYRAAGVRRVPVFLATHFRGGSAPGSWPADAAAWNEVYRAEPVASRLRDFACVQVVRTQAPVEGREPREPVHVVADADGTTLAIRKAWAHDAGEPSVGAIVALLEEGRARFAQARSPRPAAPSAGGRPAAQAPPPRAGPGGPAQRPAGGRSALDAIPLPRNATGVRVHLAFAGRVPELPDGETAIQARVKAAWDLGDVHAVGELVLAPGEEAVDRTVDVPFALVREGEEPLELGLHRIDLWIEPAGSFIFAREPLYMGVVYVDVQEGDGGGGGGGGGADQEEPQPEPQPEPEAEAQPEPQPSEEQPEPPPPPPVPEGPQEEEPQPPPPEEERVEVVDPLVREDRKVHKEDAVVAVPDPKAGLEPPPLMPLEEALREFERVLERAMGSERIRGADKAFLRRYFEALEARARGSGGGGR